MRKYLAVLVPSFGLHRAARHGAQATPQNWGREDRRWVNGPDRTSCNFSNVASQIFFCSCKIFSTIVTHSYTSASQWCFFFTAQFLVSPQQIGAVQQSFVVFPERLIV